MVLLPKSGSYSKVVLWFHGLGDSADGWAGLMPELSVADAKFVLPSATERPISINGGYEMPGITTNPSIHTFNQTLQHECSCTSCLFVLSCRLE